MICVTVTDMGRETKRAAARRHAMAAFQNRRSGAPVTVGLDELASIISCGKPNGLTKTGREFIFYEGRRALVMGPVGTAKTTMALTKFLLLAMLYPGSRWLIARSTFPALQNTSMKRFDECLERLGHDIVIDNLEGPPRRVFLASGDPNGAPVEFVLASLDDFGKLGGEEYQGIYVDEANEISEEMATTLDKRLRHKQPHEIARGEPAAGPFFLVFTCNPVNRSHWIHRKFCGLDFQEVGHGDEECEYPPWGRKFRPNRSENEKNLPKGYYATIAQGSSPEEKIRFIEGLCGPDMAGKSVFGSSFFEALHVGDFIPIEGLPMIRSTDFGRRRPACVFAQGLPNGQVIRYKAILGDNESTEQFFKNKVLPISANIAPWCLNWVDFCDPHGNQKRSTSDETDMDVMRRLGLNPLSKDVNVKRGLDLMTNWLNTLCNGRPKSQFDRNGCKILIEGYQSGYQWPTPRSGNPMPDNPRKDGFYEHVMDADRYIVVNRELGSMLDLSKFKQNLRHIRNPKTGY